MNFLKAFLFCTTTAATLAAPAQDLNEHISVEGRYEPDIIRQERLNVFPQQPIIDYNTPQLNFDIAGQTVDYQESLLAMPATGWKADRLLRRNRGYFEGGLGSYLNSDISAGYRFVDTENTTAGIWMQFNSTSLFRQKQQSLQQGQFRRRYDGAVGIYTSHNFEGRGRLSAALQYDGGWFNYYGYTTPADNEFARKKFPTQTLNSFRINLAWDAMMKEGLNWRAFANVNYTGFRTLYFHQPDNPARLDDMPGQRETDLQFGASVRMPWDNGSRLGLDALLDVVLYNGADKLDSLFPKVDNYGNLALTPYYGFQRGLLNIRLGAQIDLTANAGTKGARYHLFHIAPDVRLDWQNGPVGMYLHLLGGSELQTLALMRQQDYYTMPAVFSTRPVYSPLDARLGFSFGPFSGFSASISAAYKISNHVPLRGWYSYYMQQNNPADLSANPDANLAQWFPFNEGGIFSADNDLTIKGFSLGLDLKYKAGEMFEISAAGTYQNQNKGTGYFNGYDRPRWTVDASTTFRPVSPLAISLLWQTRAVRNIYYRIPTVPQNGGVIVGTPDTEYISMRLKDFHNLAMKVNYEVIEPLSIWVRADNLTCRSNVLMPALRSGKISIMGGFSLTF